MQIVQEDPKLSGVPGQTRGRARERPATSVVHREMGRVAMRLGQAVREERIRRHLTVRELAAAAGLGRGTVSDIETGQSGALETYVRLAEALRLRPEYELIDPRRREPLTRRAADPVHAAMGEAQTAHLRKIGFEVGLDEPFQHYQFAGRADVIAWSVERAALLHIENRTRFPDIQDSIGSFNNKRRFLGAELASLRGVARWRSETHVIAALWSTEVMRTLRSHGASFASVCPDPPDALEAWWRGEPTLGGRRSILLLFDPIAGRRSDRRRWAPLADLPFVRPRYRDYADTVAALEAPNSDR